jgi:hypothetical protein
MGLYGCPGGYPVWPLFFVLENCPSFLIDSQREFQAKGFRIKEQRGKVLEIDI